MTVVCLESLTFGLGRLVQAAEALGEPLTLLTSDPRWYRHELRGLPDGALDVVTVDTFDTEAVAAQLSRVPELRGLISSTDTWCLPGAALTAAHGLPGLRKGVLELTRDKIRVRTLLHERGLSRGCPVPLPAGTGPGDARVAELIGARTGFPAVLKDSAGTGSQNVWLARDEAELAAALREATAAGRRLYGQLFVEPFCAGPVYSAETLSWAGRTRLLGVSSRLMSPEPLFREEITAFPVAFPEADHVLLERWLDRILAALGYTDRFAHVEFALTQNGPELIEVNPRIGGALVAEGMCRALGYNVYLAMLEMALGRRPGLIDAELPGGPAVAFVLGYPSEPGALTEVSGLDRLAELPGSPAWYPTKAVGDVIEHLTDSRGYAGIVCAEAPTAELATHRAVAAANVVRVRTGPLPPANGG